MTNAPALVSKLARNVSGARSLNAPGFSSDALEDWEATVRLAVGASSAHMMAVATAARAAGPSFMAISQRAAAAFAARAFSCKAFRIRNHPRKECTETQAAGSPT